ncbi:flavodoxin family protein [Rickettsiales bacterium]|nr:flavodoxin family protein [Rickettsiales bacterium]
MHKNIVTLYHSGFGHTEHQAKSVHGGATSVEGVNSLLVKVSDIEKHWANLDKADAIIFGSPTYMGSLSAKFKEFMEATSPRWYEQKWKDKYAAGFSNSQSLSGDKLNSLMQLVIFAAQHSMIWISLGQLPDASSSIGAKDHTNRIGSYIGAMAQSDPDSKSPSEGDLETARLLGVRVAKLVVQKSK